MRTEQELIAPMKLKQYGYLMGLMWPELAECLSSKDHVQFETTREDVLNKMREYMPFALQKAMGHRGISASRSVQHFRVLVWLLDEYGDIDWDAYENYGMPILKQIAERYAFPFPDSEAAMRMANGETCSVGCDAGCGQ
jgi:hypothetical protein